MKPRTLIIAVFTLLMNFAIMQPSFADNRGKGKALGHYKKAQKHVLKKKYTRTADRNWRAEQLRLARETALQREKELQWQRERQRQEEIARQREIEQQTQPGLGEILGGILGNSGAGLLNGGLGNIFN